MKSRLILIAREVIIAADTGVPSAISILEGVQADKFPAVVPAISFLSVWKKEEHDKSEKSGTLKVFVDEKEIIANAVNFSFISSDIARHVAVI
jgi:hypothetical protein